MSTYCMPERARRILGISDTSVTKTDKNLYSSWNLYARRERPTITWKQKLNCHVTSCLMSVMGAFSSLLCNQGDVLWAVENNITFLVLLKV